MFNSFSFTRVSRSLLCACNMLNYVRYLIDQTQSIHTFCARFWNFIIYIIPLIESRRSEDGNISIIQALKKIIFGCNSQAPSLNTARTPQVMQRRGDDERMLENVRLQHQGLIYIETSNGAMFNSPGGEEKSSSDTSLLMRLRFMAESTSVGPTSPPRATVNCDPIRISGVQSAP